MKAIEFEALVRKMRAAQKYYFQINPATDMPKKIEALVRSKQLEKEVDNAVIDDIHNLVTESPIA